MFVGNLTSNDKGAIAELKIAAEAAHLGVVVSRPMSDGRRYDLVFDIAHRLYRVQCKWGRLDAGKVCVRIATCRHTPRDGYVRTKYTADEIDLIAVYCGGLDSMYLLSIDEFEGRSDLWLRVSPAKNNQRIGVRMAEQFEFSGAVAQLEERLAGSQKARGSSPLSSTHPNAA